MSHPITLTESNISRILTLRRRRIAEGTCSLYLLDQPRSRLLCKGCYIEFKPGMKAWPGSKNAQSVRKYFCNDCARRLNIA